MVFPPAYSLVKQINGRGVYSFYSPGGIISCDITWRSCTNGWSLSRRDYPTSNSGIVVELKEIDFKNTANIVHLLNTISKRNRTKSCKWAGETQKVPFQRL